MTNSEKKAIDIRARYDQLKRLGKKKGDRIKIIEKEFYIKQRMVYRHLNLNSRGRNRKTA